MNKIIFPGLNLEFNISRVAIKLFGIEIYWYAILMVGAMFIAICMFKKIDKFFHSGS